MKIVAVAAVDESTAEDAIRAIKVQYEVLPHFVSDAEPPKDIAVNNGPVSRDDFEDMEDNQVPDDQVIAAIKQNGISFKPDDKYLKDAQASGVDPKVVEALRSAKYAEAKTSRFSLQENSGAEARRSRQSLRFGGSGFRRSLRSFVHHALLPRNSRHGVGMAYRQGPSGACFHAKSFRHCFPSFRTARRSGRKYSSDAAVHRRRVRQQV